MIPILHLQVMHDFVQGRIQEVEYPGGPVSHQFWRPQSWKMLPLPPPLNMTRCETRHCNFVNTCMSEIFIQTYKF